MTLGNLIGPISEREELHILYRLFIWGSVALPLVVIFFSCVKEYRKSRAWWSWLRLLAILVLYAGGCSFFGIFGTISPFLTWPLASVIVFFGLIFAYQMAVKKRQREYAEWIRNDFPEPPNMKAGPADRSDFEDWK
jgi:hypothetical protein